MIEVSSITDVDILNEVRLSGQWGKLQKSIAARRMLQQIAAEKGVEVTEAELQKAANELRQYYNLQKAEDTWAWLENHGLTLDLFEEMIHTTILRNKLANSLFVHQVDAYFASHQLDFTEVALYEVMIEDEDLALELFFSLKEREITFFEMARHYIQDKELSRKGGYRGCLKRMDLSPAIAAAVFAAKPPQILAPIKTSQGTHLILVDEIVQPDLTPELHRQIIEMLFTSWLAQQIVAGDGIGGSVNI
jgi:parvulin-like peptidyl-prolyl isomerase